MSYPPMSVSYMLGQIVGRLFKGSRARTQPERTAHPDHLAYPMLPEEFVVFDLETTGLDPSRHLIIEVGALRVRRQDLNQAKVQVQTFQALVKTPRALPRKIVQLTGITDDLLAREGLPRKEALDQFRAFIGQCHLVSFNAPFDLSFLAAAYGPDAPIHNPTSCALQMARDAYPGLASYRLSDLTRHITDSSNHRALGDCRRALTVYLAAAKELNRR